MATQSFFKAVTLRGKKEAQAFIKAVERSENTTTQDKKGYERIQAKDMDVETIKKVFSNNAEVEK